MYKKVFSCTAVLALFAELMPWFTFNARMMGYYHGFHMPLFLIPAVCILYYLSRGSQSRAHNMA